MSKFETTFVVDYDHLNNDFSITFPRLLAFAQETGTLQTLSVGYPPQWFVEHRRGWIIAKWDCEFINYPYWNDTLTFRTWPSLFKGFMAERSYEAFLGASPVMRAQTLWIYYDLDKRRPTRPNKAECESFGQCPPPVFSTDFGGGFTREISQTPRSSRNYTVKRTDADVYGHVNNVRYMYWLLDDLTEEETKNVRRVKVSYKKECVLGQNLRIELFKNADEIAARVSDAETGEVTTSALIFLNDKPIDSKFRL